MSTRLGVCAKSTHIKADNVKIVLWQKLTNYKKTKKTIFGHDKSVLTIVYTSKIYTNNNVL